MSDIVGTSEPPENEVVEEAAVKDAGVARKAETSEQDKDRNGALGNRPSRIFSPERSMIPLTLVAGLSFLVYCAVLSPHSFGYYNDDGIYLVTAKALATGQGYRLISLPHELPQTKYPPVFPALLSMIWRLRPDFPANLTALMMVALAASILTSIVVWIYLTRQRYASGWSALAVVAFAALNTSTMAFSCGVFSEMVYAGFAVAALLLAEAYAERERSTAIALVLGVAMGLVVLTRVAGITLLMAVFLYFVLRRRIVRVLVPAGVAVLFILAWGIWTHNHRPSLVEPNSVYYTDYFRYSYDLLRGEQIASQKPLLIEATRVILRNSKYLVLKGIPSEVLGSYTGWMPFSNPQAHRILLCIFGVTLPLIGLGIVRDLARCRLLPIYFLFYIGLHLALPYRDNTYDRYLVPVLPFAILFLLNGCLEAVRLARSWRPGNDRFVRVVIGIGSLVVLPVAGFGLASYATGLLNQLNNRRSMALERSREDAEAFAWIKKNTSESAVIASSQHAMYYMYTGRKSTLCFDTEAPPGQTPAQQIRQLETIIKANKADYIVLSASDIAFSQWVDYEAVMKNLMLSGAVTLAFKAPDNRAFIFRCVANK